MSHCSGHVLIVLLLIGIVYAGQSRNARTERKLNEVPGRVRNPESAPSCLGPVPNDNQEVQKLLDEVKEEVKMLIAQHDAIMFIEKRVCLYCVQIRSLFEKFQIPLVEFVIDEMPRLGRKQLYLQAFDEIAGLRRTPALWAGGVPVRWVQKDESKGQHSDYLQPVLEGIQRIKSIRLKREMEARQEASKSEL